MPEITVLMRNVVTFMPVGTTLRNAIQQVADPAIGQFLDTSGSITQLGAFMWRWFQFTDPNTAPNTNLYSQANFSFNSSPWSAPTATSGTCRS